MFNDRRPKKHRYWDTAVPFAGRISLDVSLCETGCFASISPMNRIAYRAICTDAIFNVQRSTLNAQCSTLKVQAPWSELKRCALEVGRFPIL